MPQDIGELFGHTLCAFNIERLAIDVVHHDISISFSLDKSMKCWYIDNARIKALLRRLLVPGLMNFIKLSKLHQQAFRDANYHSSA